MVCTVSYCILLLKKRHMFSYNWTAVQKMVLDSVLHVGVNLWSLKDKRPNNSTDTCNIQTWMSSSVNWCGDFVQISIGYSESSCVHWDGTSFVTKQNYYEVDLSKVCPFECTIAQLLILLHSLHCMVFEPQILMHQFLCILHRC